MRKLLIIALALILIPVLTLASWILYREISAYVQFKNARAMDQVRHYPKAAIDNIQSQLSASLRLCDQVQLISHLSKFKSLEKKEIETLFTALRSTTTSIQVEAARAILEAKNPTLISELASLDSVRASLKHDATDRLRDELLPVRLYAMYQLSSSGHEAVQKLIPVLKSIEPRPRKSTMPGNRRMPPISYENELDSNESGMPFIPRAEPLVYSEFEYPFIVFRVLEMMEDQAAPAVPALADVLTNKGNEFTIAAIRAIGKIGPDAASTVPVLIEKMKYRRSALEGISCPVGYWGPRYYYPFADEAARALGRIGPGAVPSLIAFAENEREPARPYAMIALGHIGTDAQRAVPLIRRMLSEMSFTKPSNHPGGRLEFPMRKAAGSLVFADQPVAWQTAVASRHDLLIALASIQGWMKKSVNDFAKAFDEADLIEKEALLVALEERLRSSRFMVPHLIWRAEHGSDVAKRNALYQIVQIPKWESEDMAPPPTELKSFALQIQHSFEKSPQAIQALMVQIMGLVSYLDYRFGRFVVNQVEEPNQFVNKLLEREQVQKILLRFSRRYPEFYYRHAPWERPRRTDYAVVSAAIRSLPYVGPPAVPKLIDLLFSRDALRSREAGASLVDLGDIALAAMRTALQTEATPARLGVALPVVVQIGIDNNEARDLLLLALLSSDPSLSSQARFHFHQSLFDRTAFIAFALQKPDPNARIVALSLISSNQDKGEKEPVRELVERSKRDVDRRVVLCAHYLIEESVPDLSGRDLPVIERMVTSQNEFERKAGLAFLGDLGHEGFSYLTDRLRQSSGDKNFLLAAAMASLGPQAVAAVKPLASNPDAAVRLQATHVLAGIGAANDDARALLTDLLLDSNKDISATAYGAMLHLNEETRRAIITRLPDEIEKKQERILYLMRKWPTQELKNAARVLTRVIDHSQGESRWLALNLFMYMAPPDEKLAPLLHPYTGDNLWNIRFESMNAIFLHDPRSPATREILLRLKNDDQENVRKGAVYYLERLEKEKK